MRLRTFIGRERELAALAGAFADRPAVAIVEGPGGIGKTSVAERFVAGDVRAWWVSGEEGEALVPFGVADQLVRRAGGEGVIGATDHVAVGLQLLALLDGDAAPDALVLDDAHWADEATLRALLFAVRRIVAEPLLVVLVTRDAGLLPDGLRKLAGTHVRLAPMSADEIGALAAAVERPLSTHAARRLSEHTGGYPLYARALLDELPEDAWQESVLPVPRSYRDVIAARLRACSPAGRALVEAAAVLGQYSPLGLAAALAEAQAPLEALDEAVDAGVLEHREHDDGRSVAFSHPLARAAVYAGLPTARRAALHVCAATLTSEEGVALRHRVDAAPAADEPLAREVEAFARRELERGAWASAVANLRAASHLSAAPTDRERRLLEAIDAMLYAGEGATARRLADEWLAADEPRAAARGDEAGVARGDEAGVARGDEAGVARADEAGVARGDEAGVARGDKAGVARGDDAGVARGDDAGVARADEAGVARADEAGVARGEAGRDESGRDDESGGVPGAAGVARRDAVLAYLAIYAGDVDEADARLTRAWDTGVTGDLAATIAGRRAFVASLRFRADEIVEWSRRAIALAPGDAKTRALATTQLSVGLSLRGQRAEAHAALDAGLERAPSTGFPLRSIKGALLLGDDNLAGARPVLQAAAAEARRIGSLVIAAQSLALLAKLEFAAGAWDDAVVLADQAAVLAVESDEAWVLAFTRWTAMHVPLARGEQAPPPPPRRGTFARIAEVEACAYAEAAAAAEAPQAVLAALAPLVDGPTGFWRWQPLYADALIDLARFDEADAFLEQQTGRRTPSADEAADASRARQAGRRPPVDAQPDEADAFLGSYAGRWSPSVNARLARARGRLEAARQRPAEAERAFQVALSGLAAMPYELALTELAYGQFLRRRRRRREATTQLAAARERLLALHARPALERCERELAAAGLVSAPTPAPSVLTPQERAVARLVAAGHSNRKVADELLVSVRTVETHLTRIYAKLAVGSRSELAATYAGRREDVGSPDANPR